MQVFTTEATSVSSGHAVVSCHQPDTSVCWGELVAHVSEQWQPVAAFIIVGPAHGGAGWQKTDAGVKV
ncbi:MAG: hypothetical protein V4495_27615 [Pseudomonadota bacterium]